MNCKDQQKKQSLISSITKDPKAFEIGGDGYEQLLEFLKQYSKDKKLNIINPDETDKLSSGSYEMKFFYKEIGKRPKNGFRLIIGMHGGGGCSKSTNDGQWENHKHLYPNLPEGSIWLVPRAPTDTWNMWHQEHIDRLFKDLIASFVLYKGVNSNKVYITGYSAGGDGVYKIGPRQASLWGGCVMSAGHPNGAQLINLFNTSFSIQIGKKDSPYNRNGIAIEYNDKLDQLKKKHGGYDHLFNEWDTGHWMNKQDEKAILWATEKERNPFPNKIFWRQCSDVTNKSFYYLYNPNPVKGTTVECSYDKEENSFNLVSDDVREIGVVISPFHVDVNRKVVVRLNEEEVKEWKTVSVDEVLDITFADRLDPMYLSKEMIMIKGKEVKDCELNKGEITGLFA